MKVPYLIFSEGVDGAHSGLKPILRALDASSIYCQSAHKTLSAKSWRLGRGLQLWGIRHYGSLWNALAPWWDEARILRQLPVSAELYPVHFMFAEFVGARRFEAYRRRGGRVVVSVHCSARRWESVWLRADGYAGADEVVLTSESQRPFVERDVPRERVRTILHGVVSEYFTPPEAREARGGRLRLFMLGNTERDHEFTAQVARLLPAERFEWRVRTTSHEKSFYEGISTVTVLPRLSDEEMLSEYQQADVLAMPMLDSAANNVFLEAMACGTPVMTNCTGGVPEYVAGDCNFVLSNDRNAEEWVEKLLWLERNRDVAERMRPATRLWAERFDWKIIAEEYRRMYREVLARG